MEIPTQIKKYEVSGYLQEIQTVILTSVSYTNSKWLEKGHHPHSLSKGETLKTYIAYTVSLNFTLKPINPIVRVVSTYRASTRVC